MIHSESVFAELVGLIYEAAVDGGLWVSWLRRLEQELRTPFGVFHVHDLADQTVSVAAEIGFDPGFRRSYEEYYVSRNPFFIQGRSKLRPGHVCDDRDLCPPETLVTTEFYNDWIVPQGMLHGVNATVIAEQSCVSLLGLIRGKDDDPLDGGDVALLRALMPHLQKAVQLHRRVAALEARTKVAKEALDAWSLGVIVLDANGRIVSQNRAADAITRNRDGLLATRLGLRATVPKEAAQLGSLLRAAGRRTGGKDTPTAGAMTVSRERASRPLEIFVAPLSERRPVLGETTGATVVFVSDPEVAPVTDADLLSRLYGLTAAEARLVVRLVRGEDLRMISERQGVTQHTLRTHLKRVFEKTDTKRQSELVSLILRGPLSVRRLRHDSL